MSDQKLFAGNMVRRLRQSRHLTQAALAQALDISPSYLNLIEKNQRPLTAQVLLRLSDQFDIDPRQFAAASAPGGGVDAVARRLADPAFADLEIDRSEVQEWIAAAPRTVEAFVRAFERLQNQGGGSEEPGRNLAIRAVRREIERWRNHFADLDVQGEELADELRLGSGDIYGAIAERLRRKHQLTIRILPEAVMPDHIRRFDLHSRQLQLSEMLDPASRTFQAAMLLGQIEARDSIDALVAAGGFAEPLSAQLYARHLQSYFAAAVTMPYARFLRACEQSGYHIEILQRRFGAGFEQVAHRLTTLQRVGARGLPFFMLRVDRAGAISKRFAGASNTPLVESMQSCPLWSIHKAFERPNEVLLQHIVLEDDTRWLTLSRAVQGIASGIGGHRSQFAIALGLSVDLVGDLHYARGMDLGAGRAEKIGLGCRLCRRPDCSQRSAPPSAYPVHVDARQRGLSPYMIAR